MSEKKILQFKLASRPEQINDKRPQQPEDGEHGAIHKELTGSKPLKDATRDEPIAGPTLQG